MNWSTSSSYDMTLMFIDDAEKNHFKTIGAALKKSDANLFKKYDAVYGDLWELWWINIINCHNIIKNT